METTRSESEVESLKDICLRSISRHLPRFNAAFAISEDAELGEDLRLLQRLHSPYLIEKQLDGKGQLDEAYWNFLINEYLEELNVGICAAGNRKALLARVAQVGHVLKEVKFHPVPGLSLNVSHNIGYDHEDFSQHLSFEVDFVNKLLGHFPNARTVMLSSYCNDETLEILSKSCLELQELHFHTHRVTGNGLRSLCHRQETDGDKVKGLSLEVISLSYRDHVQEGIAFLLQNMPSLEIVDCAHLPGLLYRMHKHEAGTASQRKYNLTRLDLDSCDREEVSDLTDVLTLLVDICPRVKKLSLCISTQEQLEIISRFPELQGLRIRGKQSDVFFHAALHFDSFLKCRGAQLCRLEVDNLKLSADVLVQHCPNLESLILSRVLFEPLHSNNAVESLTALREFGVECLIFDVDPYLLNLALLGGSFDGAIVQQSIAHILKSSPHLELLAFRNCKIGNSEAFDAEFSKFCESCALQRMEFILCDVEMPLLKSVILNCSDLKALVLDNCENIPPYRLYELDEIARSQPPGFIKYTSHCNLQSGCYSDYLYDLLWGGDSD